MRTALTSDRKERGAKRNGARFALPLLALALLLGSVGCDEVFTVKNPGQIQDDDLNNPTGIDALVVGMSYDLAHMYDNVSFDIARATDEMAGSGSYFSTGLLRRGIIRRDEVNFEWEEAQEFRFVSEDGLRRMQEVLGDGWESDPRAARATFFAGLSHRILGETFCQVTFDGGPAEPKSAAFERAIPYYEDAIRRATSNNQPDLVTASHAGMAQVLADLGRWNEAVQHSAMVPTDFSIEALLSGEVENQIFNETHERFEMSAYQALAGSFDPPDPRAPYTDCRTSGSCATDIGADGQTPHLRQDKYDTEGSDIPVVKGTEMRLLEAEAALRAGDLSGAMSKINEVRAFHDLDPLNATEIGGGPTGDPSSMTGWDILDRERHLTLWLEGRRLWDLHRWDHPFLDGGGVVYPARDDGQPRASCMPIAESECDTNDNITC